MDWISSGCSRIRTNQFNTFIPNKPVATAAGLFDINRAIKGDHRVMATVELGL